MRFQIRRAPRYERISGTVRFIEAVIGKIEQQVEYRIGQFFINTVDNDFLNFRSKDTMGWGYCVFGKVVEGMDVVDKIEGTRTSTRGFFRDVPVEDIVIESAKIVD